MAGKTGSLWRLSLLALGKQFSVSVCCNLPPPRVCLALTKLVTAVGVHEAGIGLHVEYLEETEPEIIPKFLKYLMTYAIIYEATVNWPKLSICLFYYRLFPQRITRFILLVIAFILIATAVSTVIATLASCDPFWANWGNSEEQAKYCFNRETLFIWLSFPNIITDVAMLVLPLPVVWKLNAPMAIRLGLTATFVISSLLVKSQIMSLHITLDGNTDQ